MLKFRQVFHSRDIDQKVKYNIYISGPLNLLLWGSETWNLSDTNLRKLNSFHHSAIRWILEIRWEMMKEEKITNKEVRGRFNKIPPVKDFIKRCILRFLGKIVRSGNHKMEKKMLSTWIPIMRKGGAPPKNTQTQIPQHTQDSLT